jgi:hypothetical protein
MIRIKTVFSILLLLLSINFWITPVFAQNQSGSSNKNKDWVIIIDFDKEIQGMINKELSKPSNGMEITDWANDIMKDLQDMISTQVLPEYETRKSQLPACVQEAMDNYLSKKSIKIVFTLDGNTPDPSTHNGRFWDGRAGEYRNKDIYIAGVYQNEFAENLSDRENRKCTKGLIIHEMLHKALHDAAKDNVLKEKFCVKIEGTEKIDCTDPKTGKTYKFKAKRCTNRENMGSDEGIYLKSFRCGKSGYAAREYADMMRARGPRPYLDKNKQVPNRPECPLGSNCQGRRQRRGLPARYNRFVENDKFLIPGHPVEKRDFPMCSNRFGGNGILKNENFLADKLNRRTKRRNGNFFC